MSILIKNIILDGKRADIFIKEGKIEKIGKNLNFKAKEKVDGKGKKAVLPGLINSHCHAAMILFRGYPDDLSLEAWLKKIWSLEEKLNEDDIYWGTKLACLEMIKTGTTFFNDMYWYPGASIEAIKEMGLRAIVGLVMVDFSSRGSKENIKSLYQKLKNKLTETRSLSIAPHSIYTVSRENLIWVKNFAKKHNLILHLHVSETEKEVKDCLKKYKLRPIEYLDKLKLLDKKTILAHSIWLSEKEMKILGKRKASLVYCPCSNLKLGSGIFNYPLAKKYNINVCLGTDGPASNNSLDLFSEMKFVSLLQKLKGPEILPAKETFELSTKNPARFFRLDYQIREGNLADLILIDLDKVCFTPGHNFISDLIYSVSGEVVSDVICQGKILMRDREVKDEKIILKKAKELAKNLI